MASAIDNLITLCTTAFCFVGDLIAPQYSGRSRSLEEAMIPFVFGITLISGLSLFFSVFELSGGTIGQRLAGVQLVRLDGSPMRRSDWFYRHWPSFMSIALVFSLWAVAWSEPRFATTRLAIGWLTSRMALLAVPACLLLIAGYLLRRLCPRTLLIVHRPERRRGFEVVPHAAPASQADAAETWPDVK
jgi:hypothetical protein